MILNPSHEITFSGLPPDVLDAYVRYKKGTRAIVSWIVQCGPSKYNGARSLPLKDLSRLAASLAGRLKELPEVVHFHFRETIAARKRLSKYFRSNIDDSAQDAATVNHEHFTTSLTDVYESLCACCNEPTRRCETTRAGRNDSRTSEVIADHSQRFSLLEDLVDPVDNDAVPSESCSRCRGQSPITFSGSQGDIALADDGLGNRIQMAIILQKMAEYIDAVKDLWQRTGDTKIHFSTATFVTNVAFAELMRLDTQLREINEEVSIADIAEVYCMAIQDSSGELKPGQEATHNLTKRLQGTVAAIRHYTDDHQPIKIASCSTCMQRPADYIQSAPNEVDEAGKSRLNAALVDNIMHLIIAEKTPSNIVRNSSPVYADLRHVLAHREKKPNATPLTLGLHVLSESYLAWQLSSDGAAPSENCRLTALRLAQQATRSIDTILNDKTCFPCRCPQTLAYHLQNLETDLISYSKQRCWDLYFQSPWVAGNHILEVLDLCHYYGQKLFAYRHYVGSVLHSYNVLQQLAGLETVPLLEGLCHQFEGTFFPGGRPKSSFRACWTRYIGARIKFKKGHRSQNQRDSWCMAIPPHAARRAAGLGVGAEARDDKDEFLLFKIKQQDYNVTSAQWEVVSAEQDPRSKLEALSSVIEEDLCPTLESAIPAARVNHFAVFASCVKVISSVSDASHTDPKEQGINCICFADALLDGADRIVNARKLGKVAGGVWTKIERERVLDLTMKATKDELNPSKYSDIKRWTWGI